MKNKSRINWAVWLLLVLVIIVAAQLLDKFRVSKVDALQPSTSHRDADFNSRDDTGKIKDAFKQHSQDVPVEAKGVVVAILSDDNKGSRHQRFILELSSGQTILIAHNIDLAPRIDVLKKGDVVKFKGDYEFNPQGGVVHWTHHDPSGKHINGWLKHNNQIYQ